MAQAPLVIIGAGIGGLTLSRCLLHRGIPSTIYERASAKPRHGYGITLHSYAYQPLLQILGMDELTFVRCVAVDGVLGANGKIDETKLVNRIKHKYKGQNFSSFRANRAKLEGLLSDGLDVRWNCALEKLDRNIEGDTTLYFQDGEAVKSKLVVGFDGIHSKTRTSVLPSVIPTVLPYVAFNGKRHVSRTEFLEIYAPAIGETTALEMQQGGAVLQISVNKSTEDGATISWIYSRPSRGPQDPLYNPDRLIANATEIPDGFYEEISSLRGLIQPFQEVFNVEKLRSERKLHWLMRTVRPSKEDLQALQKLVTGGIVLLGDAVHAQPIIGGNGAHEAMMDGLEFADMVASDGTGGTQKWYREKYEDWSAGVQRSERAIAEMHDKKKAVM
jgi:2-polyprenyl-6-methoxyphenol hydroxylase-like FAD-dependent oxidoreductase